MSVVFVISVIDLVLGHNALPVTGMVIGPLVAASFTSPLLTAGTAVVATLVAAVVAFIGPADAVDGESWWNVVTVAVAGGLAVWLALQRESRERELSQADRVARLHATLHAALLPTPSIHAPDVYVAVRYRPGEQRMELGGDFYDIVEAADGRIAFVIGDVVGHGPESAALAATLRAAWRCAALNDMRTGDVSPVFWLERLEALLGADQGPEVFATACTGVIDRGNGVLVVSSAGHPAPLVNGERFPVISDLPLGLGAGTASRSLVQAPLAVPWALLLYTDGLIEGRQMPGSVERLGEDRLQALIREQGPLAQFDGTSLDRVVTMVELRNGRELEDDVAVVLLRSGTSPD